MYQYCPSNVNMTFRQYKEDKYSFTYRIENVPYIDTHDRTVVRDNNNSSTLPIPTQLKKE